MIMETSRGIKYIEENGEVTAKQCSKCGDMKPLDMYTKNKGKFAGVHSSCKRCKVEDKERTNERRKAWKKNNPEKVREEKRRYRERHIEKVREREREYRKRNIKRIRLRGRMRDKDRDLKGSLSPIQLEILLEKQGGKCLLSGESENLHVEHFIPISWESGTTCVENCYFMEGVLNISKGNKNPFEWIKVQSKDIQERFFNILVPMLAERNRMSVQDFETHVNKLHTDYLRDAV